MFFVSRLLRTDSYKLSHKDMYAPGLDYLYSNYTNRGSRIEGINHVVHFGLQAYLTELTEDFQTFFGSTKDEVVSEYKQITSSFVTPNFSLKEIGDLHDLQYVPLRFSGVPEGTLVPIRVPSLTIESTHPDFAWLVNYIETDLSASIWHPSTVATLAWSYRRTLDKAAEETGGAPEAVDWQLHDFSYRGLENWLAAAASSSAHLLSFFGTDVVPAIPWVNKYYPGEDNGLIGASVPATEHSVMCSFKRENEIDAFKHQLDKFDSGIISLVSDTYSLKKVITEFLPELKDQIMGRDGKVVIRPDSGDPADIICGTEREFGNGEDFYAKGAIETLWEIFDGTVNEKGFKVLDPHIGLIYGDSITPERLKDINARLKAKGFASTNWVAGVGSFSYQYITRDTFGSAVKATEAGRNGVRYPIYKDPETDNGLKKSAMGRVAVHYKANGSLYLVDQATPEDEARSLIQPVWEDGKFLKTYSFNNVRANLKRNTEILVRNGSIQ